MFHFITLFLTLPVRIISIKMAKKWLHLCKAGNNHLLIVGYLLTDFPQQGHMCVLRLSQLEGSPTWISCSEQMLSEEDVFFYITLSKQVEVWYRSHNLYLQSPWHWDKSRGFGVSFQIYFYLQTEVCFRRSQGSAILCIYWSAPFPWFPRVEWN